MAALGHRTSIAVLLGIGALLVQRAEALSIQRSVALLRRASLSAGKSISSARALCVADTGSSVVTNIAARVERRVPVLSEEAAVRKIEREKMQKITDKETNAGSHRPVVASIAPRKRRRLPSRGVLRGATPSELAELL